MLGQADVVKARQLLYAATRHEEVGEYEKARQCASEAAEIYELSSGESKRKLVVVSAVVEVPSDWSLQEARSRARDALGTVGPQLGVVSVAARAHGSL